MNLARLSYSLKLSEKETLSSMAARTLATLLFWQPNL